MKGQEAIAQLEAECLGGICVCGHHIDVHMCTPKREREREKEKEREREGGREGEEDGISSEYVRYFEIYISHFPYDFRLFPSYNRKKEKAPVILQCSTSLATWFTTLQFRGLGTVR